MGRKKGSRAWNKGLNKDTDSRVLKISLSKLGNKNPSYGKPSWKRGLNKYNDDSLRSAGEKRKLLFKEGKLTTKGKNNPFYGKKHTKDSIIKIRKARARQNFSFYNSSIELKIQSFLRQIGIEYFSHYCISDIEHAYNCDIFVPSMKLVIECDGDYFHGNPKIFKVPNIKQQKQIANDNYRNKELSEKGYNILRLWEDDIVNMDIQQFKSITLQYGEMQYAKT